VEEHYFVIADFARVVSQDAEFAAQATQVSVAAQIAPDLNDPAKAPAICWALELLRRAFDNIIRNAIRISPEGNGRGHTADRASFMPTKE
jgi:signal transduction histidine kinase